LTSRDGSPKGPFASIAFFSRSGYFWAPALCVWIFAHERSSLQRVVDITSGRYENSQSPWLARLPFRDGTGEPVEIFCAWNCTSSKTKRVAYRPEQARVGTDASSVQPSEARLAGAWRLRW